jgi:hypothetical protein
MYLRAANNGTSRIENDDPPGEPEPGEKADHADHKGNHLATTRPETTMCTSNASHQSPRTSTNIRVTRIFTTPLFILGVPHQYD